MRLALFNDRELNRGKKDIARIVIAAGGTYGHINPALSLISALKKRPFVEVIFISPNKELKDRLSKENIRLYLIAEAKIRMGSPFSIISGIFRLISAIFSCFFILLKIRPRLVVGFGGYAAFPLVFSASILGFPTAIHEQNVIMGKANRILSYFAKKILVSFEDTKGLFKNQKIAVVGNPLRQDLERIDRKDALRRLGLEEGLFTVFVMGGSSGAHKINEKFTEAISGLANKKLQVIHLSGKNDYDFVRNFYDKTGLKSRVYSFSEDVSYFFSAADLVVSRSGGSTIAEISYFKVPAVLIPYPYAGSHQKENAKVLTRAQKAVMIEDENLDSVILAKYLEDFIAYPEKLSAMKKRFIEEDNFNSAEKLAQEVLKLT